MSSGEQWVFHASFLDTLVRLDFVPVGDTSWRRPTLEAGKTGWVGGGWFSRLESVLPIGGSNNPSIKPCKYLNQPNLRNPYT